MVVALLIIDVVAVVGAIMFAAHKLEQARREKLKAVAGEMGLEFHPHGDPAVQNAIGQLRLFSKGHSRKTQNMLCGRTEDIELAIFGYRYTTGS